MKLSIEIDLPDDAYAALHDALTAEAPAGTKDIDAYARAKILQMLAAHEENYRTAKAASVAEDAERQKSAASPLAVAATDLLKSVMPDKPPLKPKAEKS